MVLAWEWGGGGGVAEGPAHVDDLDTRVGCCASCLYSHHDQMMVM